MKLNRHWLVAVGLALVAGACGKKEAEAEGGEAPAEEAATDESEETPEEEAEEPSGEAESEDAGAEEADVPPQVSRTERQKRLERLAQRGGRPERIPPNVPGGVGRPTALPTPPVSGPGGGRVPGPPGPAGQTAPGPTGPGGGPAALAPSTPGSVAGPDVPGAPSAAAGLAASVPPAPAPAAAAPPPPPAAPRAGRSGPELDRLLPLGDATALSGEKGLKDGAPLSGLAAVDGYGSVHYATRRGDFGVSLQVWRDESPRDTEDRYRRLRLQHPGAEDVDVFKPLRGFFSGYGPIQSLTVGKPDKRLVATVSCGEKVCTHATLLKLARAVEARL